MSRPHIIPLDSGHDVTIVCHAIVKAMAYECENIQYFLQQPPEKRKEHAGNGEKAIRFYQQEYTRIIGNAVREQARRQGGIYRRATTYLGRSCKEQIKEMADNTIQTIRDNTPSE